MKFFSKNKFCGFFVVIFLLLIFANAAQAFLVPCGNSGDVADACTLCHLIVGVHNIVKFGTEILITVAAVAVFIAGFMYIISSGDEGAVTKAKGFLGASLKGFTIVLMAWFFINVTIWLIAKNETLNIEQKSWTSFTCSTASSAVPKGQ